MSRSNPLALLFACVALLTSFGAVAAEQCTATPAMIGAPSPTLPHLSKALAAGHVEVLAIGSGTLLGPRSSDQGGFADYAVERLRQEWPKADIHLTVEGTRGALASEMLTRLGGELAKHHVQLVIWQTGTVEAAHKLPTHTLAQTIVEGARKIEASGSDLVLVDPPYIHVLAQRVDVESYAETMREAAQETGAAIFPRFALMKAWAQDGDIDMEKTPKAELRTRHAELTTCLGNALGDFLLEGVQAK